MLTLQHAHMTNEHFVIESLAICHFGFIQIAWRQQKHNVAFFFSNNCRCYLVFVEGLGVDYLNNFRRLQRDVSHSYAHTDMCACAHTRIVFVCMCSNAKCPHVFTCTHTHTHTQSTCVYTHICLHVLKFTHTHTQFASMCSNTHTHTHTHTHLLICMCSN